MIKKIIPGNIKRLIRIAQRKQRDRKSGFTQALAQQVAEINKKSAQKICEITQPIYYNPLAANKVANIRIAMEELERVLIQPGEHFSFWEIIEKPTVKKGYKTGRNIIGDRLQEDIGGGLCQVSGMLYHLALTSGLDILERHNHTLDLYTEDKRYTPLGADATVVYGYKDLRFKNTLKSPVHFQFDVSEDSFTGRLLSETAAPLCSLHFERTDYPTHRTIETIRTLGEKKESLGLSKYLLPKK